MHAAKEELQVKMQQIESQLQNADDAVNVVVILSVDSRMQRRFFKGKRKDILTCTLNTLRKQLEPHGTNNLENHSRKS